MKNNHFLAEIIACIVLIGLLIVFVNPFGTFMPTQMEMMLNLALIVVSALVIGLIWKERASDEREHLHKLLADRFAFLAGALLIVVALLFQGSVHQVDTWLVIVLVGMILAKIIGLIRAQMKQ